MHIIKNLYFHKIMYGVLPLLIFIVGFFAYGILVVEAQSPIPTGTVHDLGFGSSDAARIENLIRKLRPSSPMVGQGAKIIELAREYNVDPLMIVVTVNESQMCTDNGVVSPGGSNPDNYNCGGILWGTVTGTSGVNASRWNARPGPVANGHIFTFVPTIQDGLGLFYNYIGVAPSYRNKSMKDFYEIYNPCNDPGNQGRFACGAEEAQNMLNLLAKYAGTGGYTPQGNSSVAADFEARSDVFETIVGSPLSGGFNPGQGAPGGSQTGIVCPIRGGRTTCGPSRPAYTRYSSCNAGHCAGDYFPPNQRYAWCGTDARPNAEHFAIDVPGKPDETVYLPELTFPSGEVHTVTCRYEGAVRGTYNSLQQINQFNCKSDQNPQMTIWLQFHHMTAGSGPAIGSISKSGDPVAGKVEPDVKGRFPHVHIQIGINGMCRGNDVGSCVPADKYLRC
jgi:hypothetical protein